MDYASLIAAGEKFGFTGEDLRNFVSEEQKKQREERVQLLELRRQEKETAEIQLEIERQRNAKSESSSDGIRARSPKLPRFYEDKDNIDAYLQRFERYAQSQSWPTTDWAMNLSALLTGKALDVHARLTSDEAKDYRTLKTALLKAFQLTAEGFRAKFYSGKPANGETASQYANRLESYLTRWIDLSSINHRYECLFDLLLREHFMNGCHRDLAIFLRERQPKTTKDTVKLAEQYLDARGGVFRAPPQQRNNPTVHTTRPEGKTYTPQTPPRPRTPQTCYTCNQPGHLSRNCPKQATKPNVPKTCFICHKPGHFANNCRFSSIKSAGLLVSQEPEAACESEVESGTDADYSQPEYSEPIPHSPCQCPSCTNTQVRIEASCMVVRMPPDTPPFEPTADHVTFSCGHRLPLMSAACSDEYVVKDMPVVEGMIDNKIISVLRDSGCSGAIIKQDLVSQKQMTGEECTCVLIDRTLRTFPIAMIDVNTPFYVGKVRALCVKTPLYDLILGNIPGVKSPDHPDPHWKPTKIVTPGCAVQTRAQAQREGKPFRPLKTPNPMEDIVTPSVLKEAQQKDQTLHRLRELADSGAEKITPPDILKQFLYQASRQKESPRPLLASSPELEFQRKC
ncbi:uncharacterized protein LOC121421249 [Lytechinus variegatus]|uniref:uncharacterized protein LOC121421249 n=1 Tax=Lytechinus variegatus TaxID=7654 RepID=UPI001BB160BF|nr:uncharacterized protein LOC121421249 [Lytechinus variegatus]